MVRAVAKETEFICEGLRALVTPYGTLVTGTKPAQIIPDGTNHALGFILTLSRITKDAARAETAPPRVSDSVYGSLMQYSFVKESPPRQAAKPVKTQRMPSGEETVQPKVVGAPSAHGRPKEKKVDRSNMRRPGPYSAPKVMESDGVQKPKVGALYQVSLRCVQRSGPTACVKRSSPSSVRTVS